MDASEGQFDIKGFVFPAEFVGGGSNKNKLIDTSALMSGC